MNNNYIIRGLSPSGDWLFGGGINNYVQNQLAVEQDINCRLKSFLGNCFFATSDGIDWFTFLAGSKNQTAVLLAVNAVILNTQNVTGIVTSNVNYNYVNRVISITYTVNTAFSSIYNTSFSSISGGQQFLVTQSGVILTTQSGQGIII